LDKANLDQIILIIDTGEIFRIYGDINSLQEKIHFTLQRYGHNYKQEFECMVLDKKVATEATLKFTEKDILFLDVQDLRVLKTIPHLAIFGWKTSSAPPELQEKFESNVQIFSIDLGETSHPLLILGDNTIHSIESEIQNLIQKLWREHKKEEEHKRKISSQGVPCKLFSRAKAKTCDVTFRANSENKFVIQDADDHQEVLFEVPTDMIAGWVFGINLVNSSEGVILFSRKPANGQFNMLEHMIGSMQEYNTNNLFESSSDSDMY